MGSYIDFNLASKHRAREKSIEYERERASARIHPRVSIVSRPLPGFPGAVRRRFFPAARASDKRTNTKTTIYDCRCPRGELISPDFTSTPRVTDRPLPPSPPTPRAPRRRSTLSFSALPRALAAKKGASVAGNRTTVRAVLAASSARRERERSKPGDGEGDATSVEAGESTS